RTAPAQYGSRSRASRAARPSRVGSGLPAAAGARVPGLLPPACFALAAPPRTPPAMASTIANATVEVIKTPDVQAKFRAGSVDPIGNSSAEMAAFIKAEAQRWGDVIKKNNIVVD